MYGINCWNDINCWNYGNRGNNGIAVTIGKLTVYFSYDTIIAIRDSENHEFHISENIWSKTTGGHLNSINSDTSIREKHIEFEKNVNKILKKYNLINDE